MKKFALVLLAVSFTASVAQAQIVSSKNSRITVERQKNKYEDYNRISLGLSSLKIKDSEKEEVLVYDEESIGMKGLDINYMHGFSMTGHFPLYLEVGGRLTINHYKKSENEYEDEDNYYDMEAKTNVMALSIPVNATYKHTFSNGMYIAPFVGLHLRLNMIGKLKMKEKNVYRGHVEFDNDDNINLFNGGEEGGVDEEDCKRVQFGGQLGVNLGYKTWNLGFAYYLDTPFYKDSEFKLKSSEVALTVGYNF